MSQGSWWQVAICYHLVCRFHDICLNHTSLEWQYYVDPEAVEVPLFYHYLNGHPVYEFPDDFVMTGHVHILPYTTWAPKVCPFTYGRHSQALQSCACRSHPWDCY